jgi:hypothetical protein
MIRLTATQPTKRHLTKNKSTAFPSLRQICFIPRISPIQLMICTSMYSQVYAPKPTRDIVGLVIGYCILPQISTSGLERCIRKHLRLSAQVQRPYILKDYTQYSQNRRSRMTTATADHMGTSAPRLTGKQSQASVQDTSGAALP